jgi:hypothetical protein
LINIQHVKFGALSAALLLSTIILTTIDLSQNSVFAQITPAPEKFGSNGDESSSSDDGDSGNDGNNESTGSSDSIDDGNGDSPDTSSSDDGDSPDTSSSDDGDSPDTSSSEEEDDTEDDSEQTNPLLEQIRNSVNGALSASGMPGPGF